MNDFLIWAGWGVGEFYSKPLGLLVVAILAITASMRVLRPRCRDHWADTLFFAVTALVYLMTFAAGISGRIPHYTIKTILILLAVRAVWRGYEDWKAGELKQ